ncbi:Gfo/Idh/MocA family protein [Corallincola platygyrae]|uniref:Gfo/Idh/MocA family protein n=1 Tax=Corallincola platygyrae TaxID=1193278 RepID=A0ABW4XIF5_9GAMM
MNELRVGIVGAGMIAGVLANAINQATGAKLVAVASRRRESAEQLASEFSIPTVFDDWQSLIGSDQLDAVYIATPTAVREEIAVAAANAGKHVIGEKPFASAGSLERIIAAAQANGVAFMDATHFVHHPRTLQIKAQVDEEIGSPKVVRTSFFFPFMDRSNIRFNPEKEPTGAVGDMAWYSMRAITEYLQPEAPVKLVSGGIVRDQETGAVVRGTGVIQFEDGKSSSFDFGYDAGVCLMDLDILGERGMLHLNDYVLDWKQGFAFDHADHTVGYTRRTEMQAPSEFVYVEAESDKPQAVKLVEDFVEITQAPTGKLAKRSAEISLQTQKLLDAYWNSVQSA